MKQFYTFSKTLLVASAMLVYGSLSAQTETTVSIPACPNVTQDFTGGNGAFTSPSVYGNVTFDSAFFYNGARGIWTEMGSTLPGKQTPNTPNRVVNIVSPPYPSTNPTGMYDVGFYYIVPNIAADRFNVTLVRLTTVPGPGGDITFSETVARSGFKTFASFSAAGSTNVYVDPVNPLHNGTEGVICIRLNDPDITTGASISYRVEVTYIITEGNFSAFDDFRIELDGAPAPLPVSFMGLVANRVDQGVTVRWDVADETDVQQYELERSTNGASFTTVGIVAANGRPIYSYTDPSAKAGTLYYRVKSRDIDGQSKYSGIVKVSGNDSFSGVVKAYPSPARSSVTLAHGKLNASARVTVTTADGRVVKVLRPNSGVSNTMIDISNLTSGMYIIKVDDGKGNIESTTIVKQ